MKPLPTKKAMVAFAAIVCCLSMNAQLISTDKKFKKNFPAYMYQKRFITQNHSQLQRFNPSWDRVNVPHLDGSYISDIEVPDARTVWGGIGIYAEGIPFTIYYVLTQDGGHSWKLDSLPLSTEYGVSTFAAIDGYTCYASVANLYNGGGGVYKTTNGGKTWDQLSVGKLFNAASFPDFIHFFDPYHGVAVGDGNGPGDPYFEIYTTSNAGASWDRVPRANIPSPNGFPYSFNDAYYAVDNIIWFQGFDSNGGHFIYRSDDRGHNWQAFPVTVSTNFASDFAFSDGFNGLLTSFDDNGITELYKTHDGGKSWTSVNYSGVPMGLNITAIPGISTYVTTSSAYTAVFGSSYSTDNGKTWNLIDSGANTTYDDVKFLNSRIGWCGESEASSSDPGGMFKWKGNFSTNAALGNLTTAKKEDVPEATSTLSVYPNPVSNLSTISFNLPEAQEASINIYDMNGRLIKILVDEQMQPGAHQLTWDVKSENVVAGNYLLKLQAGNSIQTMKISVVH